MFFPNFIGLCPLFQIFPVFPILYSLFPSVCVCFSLSVSLRDFLSQKYYTFCRHIKCLEYRKQKEIRHDPLREDIYPSHRFVHVTQDMFPFFAWVHMGERFFIGKEEKIKSCFRLKIAPGRSFNQRGPSIKFLFLHVFSILFFFSRKPYYHLSHTRIGDTRATFPSMDWFESLLTFFPVFCLNERSRASESVFWQRKLAPTFFLF